MSDEIFTAHLEWQTQNLPFTFESYSRQYLVRMPGKPDLIGTSAPAYAGSPYYHNPEDLLVASLSACHMLTYLAIACKMKIPVIGYEDRAEGVLGKGEDGKVRMLKVTLKPVVRLASGADTVKAALIHEKAHTNCFIANSVNFPVTFETDTVVEQS